ncbi:MAG: GAF domain-containing protein [Bifidobacteriaceae bacterium]|jgi:signal transduction histidine kinase|nr:GAF domain-containing protein [Bifidobacteriaceae bacterium]
MQATDPNKSNEPMEPAPHEPGIAEPLADKIAATAEPAAAKTEADLLDAVVSLSRRLDLAEVLAELVQTAPELTGAGAAAVNILDGRGIDERFYTHGADEELAAQLGQFRRAMALMARIPTHEPLILDQLPPSLAGLPPDADMLVDNLLAVPVRVRHTVFAHVYLVNKPGGFTAEDARAVATLATAAGVMIENAQLYQASQRRESWLAAGQGITTMLLSGVEEEEALTVIASQAKDVAGAATAALILPSVRGQLIIEIAEGVGAESLVGSRMPTDGRSHTVLTEGIGMIVDSLSGAYTLRVSQLREYGPALYAPMRTSGRSVGVMLLLRENGSASFDQADLTTAESFASQAALALVLAEARHTADLSALVSERERIARDLHDLAIQQLFATGMRLESARQAAAAGVEPEGLVKTLTTALDSIDSTVREIRAIVSHLRNPGTDEPIAERLRHEASAARALLGFAPSLVLLIDGRALGSTPDDEDSAAADALVSPSLADDLVAVVREGLSNAGRHAKAASVAITVGLVSPDSPGVPDGRPGQVTVVVEDDGVGLPTGPARQSGLSNLSDRAVARGGVFSAATGLSGRGTRLEWVAPLG